MEARMEAACDTVDAGDEKMYRLSETKLMAELLSKAKAMVRAGLPASMEAKFVQKALEAPVLVQKSFASQGKLKETGTGSSTIGSEVSTPQTESVESQSSVSTVDSNASFVSVASTTATSIAEEEIQNDEVVSSMQASAEIINLQRLQVAFKFICASYIAPAMATTLQEQLLDQKISKLDFIPLNDYLAKVTKARADALASRSLGDYSQKRCRDEEEDEARADKKRKLELEKAKKASESRAIRDLKKVDTSGMRKLSDFFKKK
jgi:hypothetical protein